MADTKTTLTTTWEGFVQGNGRIASDTMDLPIAIPQSYGGSGTGSHPKELLMASAATCYLMTIAAMSGARKRPLAGITMESELSDIPSQGMRIVHLVRIEMTAEAAQEQLATAQVLFEAADKACMVGKLLKAAGVQIDVSGAVTIA